MKKNRFGLLPAIMTCAAALVMSVSAQEARARASRIRADEVICCDGTPFVGLTRGLPVCLAQPIDLSGIPLELEDLSVSEFRVSIDGVAQPLRGEPVLDAEGRILFTILPTRGMGNGTLVNEFAFEPKSRVVAGYYDVPAWYELTVTWPTFFSASSAHMEDEEEEVTATVDFNPFPCTWFLGKDYVCNSTSWLSG